MKMCRVLALQGLQTEHAMRRRPPCLLQVIEPSKIAAVVFDGHLSDGKAQGVFDDDAEGESGKRAAGEADGRGKGLTRADHA